MSFRFPTPDNEDDFELLCLRFVRLFWSSSNFQQYGERGERQHGIDLIDQSARKPLRAVQCKHHEAHKTIPPAEIKEEVDKVLAERLFAQEIGRLAEAGTPVQEGTSEWETLRKAQDFSEQIAKNGRC